MADQVAAWPGSGYPLGATYDGVGTNFALFSDVAERVELCLFGDDGTRDAGSRCGRWTASSGTATCPASARASATATGCTAPTSRSRGHRCNPAKLLLDPYAKAIEGEVDWDPAVFGYQFDDRDERNDADSAPHVPRSVVVNPYFDWADDRPPRDAVPRDASSTRRTSSG